MGKKGKKVKAKKPQQSEPSPAPEAPPVVDVPQVNTEPAQEPEAMALDVAAAQVTATNLDKPLVVCTETASDNLVVLRRALAVQRCVLLSGSVGSGKTTMARFLAVEKGKELVSVGLDSSVDIKDLIGTFRSTAPGCFDFMLGPLAECVENGNWLLLEDLDLASSDVTSALVALLQTGELYVPEQDKVIRCSPSFRLLATVQTSGTGGSGRRGVIPHMQLWGNVSVLPQSTLEMFQCVATACPNVNHSVLLSVKQTFETLYSVANASVDDDVVLEQCPDISHNEVKRLLPHVRLSLRELLRWGRRMMVRAAQCTTTEFIDTTTRGIMYLEALDSFCKHLPESKGYSTMARTIGAGLGVTAETQTFLLEHHRPQVTGPENGVFTIGRQSLQVHETVEPTHKTDANFGDTKSSLALMERLAVCVKMIEPVLLTGETGVGKTYMVQHLANQLNQDLVVHNLNQQSETSDIIGGYKPTDMTASGTTLSDRAVRLMQATYGASNTTSKTMELMSSIQQHAANKKWIKLASAVKQVSAKTVASLEQKLNTPANDKRARAVKLHSKWVQLLTDATNLDVKAKQMKGEAAKAAFEFVEGTLVSSFREGKWLLLDEINLADAEILERISQAIELVHHVDGDTITATARLTITEKGGDETGSTVSMHPNFRLFACMNPPTDVGKKDLPPSLKSRFTELYCDELTDRADLRVVVDRLIGTLVPDAPIENIVDYYLACREHSATRLTDNDPSTPKPHYSLRTLTRALRFTRQIAFVYGFEAALLEGIFLCFYSQLSRPFQPAMNSLVSQYLLRGKPLPQVRIPPHPSKGSYVQFEHFWLELGALGENADNNYIITQSVSDHLRNLARIVVAGRAVLLQGPTAAGKTSMVEYLAKVTGHRCVRINNHETTDIQEYVGQYINDDTNRLRFVEGALVTACREGHWIILDELNLAPSEVLEALNRLLDDNRELLIPETMEVIKPHPHFRLFATQNPPGVYGGRKQLSRAMRNRFMEILVDDIPHKELEEILHRRYGLPSSFAQKMVEVMTTLQIRRQNSAIFQGKHGFITPRDLFRWAERKPSTWDELVMHGMFLLGDRCRKPEERIVVKTVIQDVMKATLPSDDECYNPSNYKELAEPWERFKVMMGEGDLPDSLGGGRIVPTKEFRRLFVLVGLCLHFSEPFVLVGETGGGKTTVCQLWGYLMQNELTVVNCHQHSETSDFLGAFRPASAQQREDSGALFSWMDGPLIQCMHEGTLFMLDEVSLAEDAVLERLNSVFEPARSITIPEKGEADLQTIKAHPKFRVMATMNPAGDFGKKELSPALRNRMTEIHVTSLSKQPDLVVILRERLQSHVQHLADVIVSFMNYLQDKQSRMISIRDVMAVCRFASLASMENGPLVKPLTPSMAFVIAIDAILLAGLAIGTGMGEAQAARIRKESYEFLGQQEHVKGFVPATIEEFNAQHFWDLSGMPVPEIHASSSKSYSFHAPTTQYNLSAILRVLWTLDGKAVLLEGSPGVGKTTLVQTLGAALGTQVVRFNLSEQTDMSDLVGTFLPDPTAKDGKPSFRWSDGMLLQAMVNGWWVVLDELNLASQSVLEGLNALLDHRAELFIPELNKVFKPAKGFRVFGCQNPVAQGGGRKGLPKSFLNRFTRVWVNAFVRDDLITITKTLFPELPLQTLTNVVDFVSEIDAAINVRKEAGRCGGPWEFNLRDISRWCNMLADGLTTWFCCFTLFTLRFRTDADRSVVAELYERIFKERPEPDARLLIADGENLHIGNSKCFPMLRGERTPPATQPVLLPGLPMLVASMVTSLRKTSLVLLCGPSGAGKTSAVELAARICGAHVSNFPISSGTDTVDLLGQFQQRGGCFVWQDSLLIKALEEGNWLVLDNANFASATVLDRLNGLLEPNGDLVLNEAGVCEDGEIRVVKPHPQFRLILSMDTKHGEVSRAMRNRGVELFMPPIDAVSLFSTAVCVAAHVSPAPSGNLVQDFADALQEHQDDYMHLLAKWHYEHLDRTSPIRKGEWGRVGARAQAPTLNTLMRCVDLAQLILKETSQRDAVVTAVEQCYLRGLQPKQHEAERLELDKLIERFEHQINPKLLVRAFSNPFTSDPSEQALFYLMRAAAFALTASTDEKRRVRTCIVPHYNRLSKDVSLPALQQFAAAVPEGAECVRQLAVALESVPVASACTPETLMWGVDISAIGIRPLPPCANVSDGYAMLPFTQALCEVLRASADTCDWAKRDKALCAFADLAAATVALQHSSSKEKGAWRSAAGAAGALARLVPMTASDADVLSWLHCYLRLARASSKLRCTDVLKAQMSDFDAKVVQHFSLVGDLRSPRLWKKGGHPSPCPAEHHEALNVARTTRKDIVMKVTPGVDAVTTWKYVATLWGLHSLQDVYRAQSDRKEMENTSRWAALARVASTRCSMLAADSLPLKLAAEGTGFTTDLQHPVVDALLSRIAFCDWQQDEEDDDEGTVLADAANDRYSRHMLSSPCKDLISLIQAHQGEQAYELLTESVASMKRIADSLGACVAMPRWDEEHSIITSMRSTAGLVLASTLQSFLDGTEGQMHQCVEKIVQNPSGVECLREFKELSTAEHSELLTPVQGYCSGAVSALLACDKKDQFADAVQVGCSIALLGAWRLVLLQPTSPLDPATRAKCKAEAAQRWWELRTEHLTELMEMEALMGGAEDMTCSSWSEVTSVLGEHCERLESAKKATQEKAVHRRSETEAHDRFPALFWEARQFVTSVASFSRLEQLCKRLTTVSDVASREVAIKEATIVANASETFASALDKYIGYEDITSPLRSSAALMQLGLAMASRSIPMVKVAVKGKKRKGVPTEVVETPASLMRMLLPQVLSLPSVALGDNVTSTLRELVAKVFSAGASEKDHWGAVRATIHSLRVFQDRSALAFAGVTSGDSAAGALGDAQRVALSDCETVYGAWVALWDVIEAEEQRRAELAAEQVKYKNKTQEIEGDDEALERTLNELFPSYIDSFETEKKKDDDSASEEEPEKADDDTIAYDVRRMRDTMLGKGELLDVVLQYVCMVSDSVKLRFTHESADSVVFSVPKSKKRRNRNAKNNAEKVNKARMQLMASSDQLEEDAMPEVPAPDLVVANELLDAPSTEIVRRRLQPSALRERLSQSNIAASYSLMSAIDSTFDVSQPAAHMLLRETTHLPCLAYSFLMTKRGNESAQKASPSSDVTEKIRTGFNIYKEADLAEATHGLASVAPLLHRVEELLVEFPEHPPLLSLQDIIKRVLLMNPRTDPLMKILQGTELVLKNSHEWETSAHKGVSIAEHIKRIGSAVLRWRRLELHCWPHLLHSRRREKEEHACRHAFTLWGLVQNAMIGDEHEVSDMWGPVMAFVTDTTFAEFDLRVRLLSAHGQRLALAIADGGSADTPTCRVLCNIFLNAAAYFGTFLKEFQDSFSTESKVIRKRLSEFIKIQRWEDANYYALMASTSKSHREIAKVLRLWDVVLHKGMVPFLARQEDKLDERLVLVDEGGVVPPPLVNKQKGVQHKKRKKKEKESAGGAKDAKDTSARLDDDEDEPVSPFNVALTDAAATLTEELPTEFATVKNIITVAGNVTTMCDQITSRVADLMPPSKAKKTEKQRALKTLLDAIKDEGIEDRNGVDRYWREGAAFESTFYCIELSLAAEGKNVWPSSNGLRERLLWMTAERDYYRSITAMRRLGRAYVAPNGDINEAQVMRMRIGINQLFDGTKQQRSHTIPSLAQRLSAFNTLFTAADENRKPTKVPEIAVFESALREVCEVTTNCLNHASGLQQVVGLDGLPVDGAEGHLRMEDMAARSPLQQILAACESAVGALRTATNKPELRTVVSGLRTRITHIETSTKHAMASGVAQTVIRHCLAASKIFKDAAPLAKCCDQVADVCKAMQELVETTDGHSTLMECNRLSKEMQLEAGTKVLLGAAAEIAADPSLKASLPWEAIADAQHVTEHLFRSSIQYHCASARLTLLLARLYGTLLKKGYCGQKDEEEGEGEGDEKGDFQEGTGMDDGEGKKDVSDEIENEDQILSAKDQEQEEGEEKQKEEKQDEEEEDNALDVTNDFAGDLEDAKKNEPEEDDEDQDDESMSKEEAEVDGEDQEETKGEQHQDDNENLRDAENEKKHEKMDDDEFTDEDNKQDEEENKEDEEDGGWNNNELDDKMDDKDDKGSQEGELAAKDGGLDDEGDDDGDGGSDGGSDSEQDDDEKDDDQEEDSGGEGDAEQQKDVNEDADAEDSKDDDKVDEDGENEVNPNGEQEEGDDASQGTADEEGDDMDGKDIPDQQKGADQGIDDGRAGEDDTAQRDDEKEPQSKKGEEEQAPVDQMQDSATGETMTQAKQGARSQTNKEADHNEDKKESQAQEQQDDKKQQQEKSKKESAADPFKALGQLLEKMQDRIRAEDSGRKEENDDQDDGMDVEADEHEIAPKDADTEQHGQAAVKEDDDIEKMEQEDFTKDPEKDAEKEGDDQMEQDKEEKEKEDAEDEEDEDAGKPKQQSRSGGKKSKKPGKQTADELADSDMEVYRRHP